MFDGQSQTKCLWDAYRRARSTLTVKQVVSGAARLIVPRNSKRIAIRFFSTGLADLWLADTEDVTISQGVFLAGRFTWDVAVAASPQKLMGEVSFSQQNSGDMATHAWWGFSQASSQVMVEEVFADEHATGLIA